MTLTNKQLQALLKKLPPDAIVAWKNPEQDEHECDGFIEHCELASVYYPALIEFHQNHINEARASDVIILR